MHPIPTRQHRKIHPVIQDQPTIRPYKHIPNRRRIPQNLLRPGILIAILHQRRTRGPQFPRSILK
jgi:hypothetical protein